MNSPIIPCINDAFEKAISVAVEMHEAQEKAEGFIRTLRAVHRSELTALRHAIVAEEKSRKVAIEELRKTIVESLAEYQTAVDLNGDPESAKDEYLFAVGQWLDRIVL